MPRSHKIHGPVTERHLMLPPSLVFTHQVRQAWSVPAKLYILYILWCQQRNVERENERKKGEVATLYPGVEVASDGEADDM